MTRPDYDDPATEEKWCMDRQADVARYLKEAGVVYRNIGEWPAWHVAPYVSIWAIESAQNPSWVGWWVICGDLPTDYISADSVKHPRDAMRTIAERWLELVPYMARGEGHPRIAIGVKGNHKELAPLIERRAAQLLKWANDDTCWGPEYD